MAETSRQIADRIFREHAEGSRVIDNQRVTVVREVALISAIEAALITARQQQREVDAGIALGWTGDINTPENARVVSETCLGIGEAIQTQGEVKHG